jgi:hypothetical protein
MRLDTYPSAVQDKSHTPVVATFLPLLPFLPLPPFLPLLPFLPSHPPGPIEPP